jgi:hypothetical protein
MCSGGTQTAESTVIFYHATTRISRAKRACPEKYETGDNTVESNDLCSMAANHLIFVCMQREAAIWGCLTFQGSKSEAKSRREQSVAVTHDRLSKEDETRRDARLDAHE